MHCVRVCMCVCDHPVYSLVMLPHHAAGKVKHTSHSRGHNDGSVMSTAHALNFCRATGSALLKLDNIFVLSSWAYSSFFFLKNCFPQWDLNQGFQVSSHADELLSYRATAVSAVCTRQIVMVNYTTTEEHALPEAFVHYADMLAAYSLFRYTRALVRSTTCTTSSRSRSMCVYISSQREGMQANVIGSCPAEDGRWPNGLYYVIANIYLRRDACMTLLVS